ncbi:tetratricopeptide repeat protein [candidate division WOR-3 bacterium]|nr:tetratricopeptide repeat protein [candidate division WOR-3 bacterium]
MKRMIVFLCIVMCTSLFGFSKWLNTARITYQDGDFDRAKYACESGIAEGERHFELYAILGGSLIGLGDYQAAAIALDSAFVIDSVQVLEWMVKKGGYPYYYQAYYFSARELFEKALYEPALAKLVKSPVLAPDDINTLVLKGTIFYQLDRLDQANAVYRRILDIDPDNADVHFLIGKALFEGKQFDSSLVYMANAGENYKKEYDRKAQLLFKNLTEVKNELVQKILWLWSRQDLDSLDIVVKSELLHEDGIVVYKKTIEQYAKVAGDLARSYYYIGMSYYYLKNDSLALQYLKTSLKYNPDDPDALFFTGESILRSGDYQGALPYFRYLVHVKHDDVYGWFYIGVCYMQLKDFEKALDAFENHVLALNPGHIDAMTNLAYIYNEQGNSAKANEYLNRVQELQDQ